MVSVTSHSSSLASFSRLERQVAFVLLRTLLEPLILGLLCSWYKENTKVGSVAWPNGRGDRKC